MAGGPAAETVMFVGAVLAAGLIAGSLGGIAAELSEGMEARADDLGARLRGRFAIVNDPVNVPYADPVLTIYLVNTGSQTLYTAQFMVMVDGQARASLTFSADGVPTEVVRPGDLVEVQVSDAAGLGGDHTLVVVAGNGHKERMEFRI